MMQIPNLPNNYVPVVPQQPGSSANAVKIDIFNPTVNAPQAQGQYQAQMPMTPTMPIYNYPQAPYQPYYPPIVNTQPQPPVVTQTPQSVPAVDIPVQPQMVPPAPVVENAPKAEAEKPAQAEKPVDVVPPQDVKPQVDLNAFLAKLTNPDYEVQASAMEEIANMVDKEPQKALDLLDNEVVEALENIIKADTSALAGPTPEQEALRQKMFNNEQLTDTEKVSALTMSPKEQAERNKSYAIFTSAILQKLYSDEYRKMNNVTVPITELPGIVTVIEQLKNNPNAMVRTSAIEALSYIQDPEYKKDLNTIFTIAQNDVDNGVKEAAKEALAKLNQIQEPAKAAA